MNLRYQKPESTTFVERERERERERAFGFIKPTNIFSFYARINLFG
jgi:hypothetical protein